MHETTLYITLFQRILIWYLYCGEYQYSNIYCGIWYRYVGSRKYPRTKIRNVYSLFFTRKEWTRAYLFLVKTKKTLIDNVDFEQSTVFFSNLRALHLSPQKILIELYRPTQIWWLPLKTHHITLLFGRNNISNYAKHVLSRRPQRLSIIWK